jgi:YHS domain-containing protein
MPHRPAPQRMPALLGLAATLLLAVAAALFAGSERPATGQETLGEDGLQRVEAIKVCMVNDQLFEKDQIPVEVEGKTYYGCCVMCKERLANDEGARTAADPVTGEPVDKATAVIASRVDGSVLYFASEENLRRYREGDTQQ